MIIEINKDIVPYEFDIDLGTGTIFTFLVKYNQEYDYFTVDLSADEEVIVEGEKIVFGRELFIAQSYKNVPSGIMPYDASEQQTRCGSDQLGETVFLYILEGV